tara:strand:- start:17075 stop:17590 length:516 start_codon:yes stop_codon:yes gene_type:complete
MGESKSSGSTSGVSVLGVVQIVFLILKLCNVDPIGGWPWWQVMLPLEISTGCMCCLCGCYISLVCCLKDDTVSTPGTQLSIEQRDMLYNITSIKPVTSAVSAVSATSAASATSATSAASAASATPVTSAASAASQKEQVVSGRKSSTTSSPESRASTVEANHSSISPDDMV